MSNDEPVEVGESAMEFSLRDQDEEEVKLSNFEGEKVLLSFHPLAWTEVCKNQMQSLEENYERFNDLSTVPLGISVDPVPTKKAWSEEIGLDKTRILADFWPHGEVAKKYGIFIDEKGISERANILINEEREIEFVEIYDIHELPDIDEVIEKIERI